MGLGADFDDLAFEDFQRFLNQRIVFEIVFIECDRSELFLWRGGGSRRSGRFLGRSARNRSFGWQRLRQARWCAPKSRSFGFDELELSVRMAKFMQLSLQQIVI